MAPNKESSWNDTFNMLDVDKSGFIETDELSAVLIALGQQNSDEHVAQLLEAEGISFDGDNVKIDQAMFLKIVESNGHSNADNVLTKSSVFDMFQSFDIDQSGYLTVAELAHFLANLGTYLGDEKMSQLLRMYDDDGNARISFEEFRGIVIDMGFEVVDDEDEPSGAASADIISIADSSPKPEEEGSKGKIISLASIADEDLRKALAPFDKTGSGTIDLAKVQECAEGSGPAKLHWSEKRPDVPLSNHIRSVNHIALIVSDVSKSLDFYKNVMSFEQIRRPNFDAHGAWLTMGNVELHLIKGKPVVYDGDDLVVGHISIDAQDINGVLTKLKMLKVPYRKNTSVPSGADAGTTNTNENDNMMSTKIVTQFFFRDPDGYYLEICNCDETLTDFCLGRKDDLPGYNEGVKPLSLDNALATIKIMQRWVSKLDLLGADMKSFSDKVKGTSGSIKEVAAVLKCNRADKVNPVLAQNSKDRYSRYGDVWQNEEFDDIETVLLEAGNDSKLAESIVKLREEYRGVTIFRPPAVFRADGTKHLPDPIFEYHNKE